MFLPADRYLLQEIGFLKFSQVFKHGVPPFFPGGEEVLPGVFRAEDEFGVPVSPGLVSVGGQKVGPAGGQVPGDVFDNDGDTVEVFGGLLEEALVGNLPECFLCKLFLLAETEKDVFEVSIPK
jgi:hypothetical protein